MRRHLSFMDQNVKAAETWVADYGDLLLRFALTRVHDEERAEDLVQETFLAAFRNRDSFDGRSSFQTWLISILKHKILDYYRTKWRETPISDLEPEGASSDWTRAFFDEHGHWANGYPNSWGRSGAALEESEFMGVLGDCLKRLPVRLATAFSLKEIEDLESEEVCQTLQITPVNFWAMMHRARARLRDCLEKHWFRAPETGSQ